MSLKSFHIFFVAVSILMAIGFGIWEVLMFTDDDVTGRLIAASLSFGVAVALIVYGIRFVRKQKHLGYL